MTKSEKRAARAAIRRVARRKRREGWPVPVECARPVESVESVRRERARRAHDRTMRAWARYRDSNPHDES